MSKKHIITKPRSAKTASAAQTTDSLTRKAQTLLLARPALETLRAYRAGVVEHCDRVIAMLESLEAHATNDAPLSPAAARALDITIPGFAKSRDKERSELAELCGGPVMLAEVAAREILLRLAGEPGPSLADGAYQIARALEQSYPAAWNFDEADRALEDGMKASGFEVDDWEHHFDRVAVRANAEAAVRRLANNA